MKWNEEELLLDVKNDEIVQKYAFEGCTDKDNAIANYKTWYWNYNDGEEVIGTVIFCTPKKCDNTTLFNVSPKVKIFIKTFYLKESRRKENQEGKGEINNWSEYMMKQFLLHLWETFFDFSKISWGSIIVEDVTSAGFKFFNGSDLFININTKNKLPEFINKNIGSSDIHY